jgi:hypothetical protein
VEISSISVISGKVFMQNKQNLDAGVLEIASLTDLPSQPVHLELATSFLGTQVQQLKTAAAPPVVNSAAPVTITRRNLGNGVLQYRVQFIAPTPAQDPKYQTTSILIATPTGTTRLAASSGAGPIIFTSTPSTAPGSVVLQQSNSNGTSQTGMGQGNSRALVQM